MKKIAVLFSGIGSNFAYLAKHLQKQQIEISVALTNNPNAGGIKIAKEHNIPLKIIDSSLYKIREEFDQRVVDVLVRYNLDLTVLAGFMRILTPVFTKQIKAINLHPSLLPRHKGLHAIEKSYHDEYSTGGVSIHFVDSKLDSGKVILQREITKENLSFEEYNLEVRRIEKEALFDALQSCLGIRTN